MEQTEACWKKPHLPLGFLRSLKWPFSAVTALLWQWGNESIGPTSYLHRCTLHNLSSCGMSMNESSEVDACNLKNFSADEVSARVRAYGDVE